MKPITIKYKALEGLLEYVKNDELAGQVDKTAVEFWVNRYKQTLEPEYFEEVRNEQ